MKKIDARCAEPGVQSRRIAMPGTCRRKRCSDTFRWHSGRLFALPGRAFSLSPSTPVVHPLSPSPLFLLARARGKTGNGRSAVDPQRWDPSTWDSRVSRALRGATIATIGDSWGSSMRWALRGESSELRSVPSRSESARSLARARPPASIDSSRRAVPRPEPALGSVAPSRKLVGRKRKSSRASSAGLPSRSRYRWRVSPSAARQRPDGATRTSEPAITPISRHWASGCCVCCALTWGSPRLSPEFSRVRGFISAPRCDRSIGQQSIGKCYRDLVADDCRRMVISLRDVSQS